MWPKPLLCLRQNTSGMGPGGVGRNPSHTYKTHFMFFFCVSKTQSAAGYTGLEISAIPLPFNLHNQDICTANNQSTHCPFSTHSQPPHPWALCGQTQSASHGHSLEKKTTTIVGTSRYVLSHHSPNITAYTLSALTLHWDLWYCDMI